MNVFFRRMVSVGIGAGVEGLEVYDENSSEPYCEETSTLFSEIWINTFNAMGKYTF